MFPLAIEATEIYRGHYSLLDKKTQEVFPDGKPFLLANLHITRHVDESMAINTLRSSAIIIAGSGMCEGGRVRHHFKHHIGPHNCHLLFVGFQVGGSNNFNTEPMIIFRGLLQCENNSICRFYNF